MIVCSCNVLSDGQIRDCLAGEGCPKTASEVYECLGCSPKCGRCARTIRQILHAALGAEVHSCTTSCAAACPVSPHRHAHAHQSGHSHQGTEVLVPA